jgi:MFS transporter, NNP family, nitrate/nitrite transporter
VDSFDRPEVSTRPVPASKEPLPVEKTAVDQHLIGSPRRGLATATLGLGAGLTTIVLYGVAGPEFMEWLGLSGTMLGVLLASPHLSKALLRIPFGAWVDEVGGRKPFLVLLSLTVLGLTGVVAVLLLFYPSEPPTGTYPALLLFGLLAGAGGATFSVGAPKTSYWFPKTRQGFALGVYAGAGNVGPGVFNYAIPVLIAAWGLTGAYIAWLAFLIAATGAYAIFAMDAYYFQLVARDVEPETARNVAAKLGQDVFPSGSARQSLKTSATNGRTWILVFLYAVSFGGGFTALTAWFPTYWALFHGMELTTAGLLAAMFTIYGSLIRIPGGSLSDRLGGEDVGAVSFLVMVVGATVLMLSSSAVPAFVGMMILGTGMGVANAAVFELVPVYVPEAVGGASGWIGGLGGAGTLLIVPALGRFVDVYGQAGFAHGFVLFVGLSAICAVTCFGLRVLGVRPSPVRAE